MFRHAASTSSHLYPIWVIANFSLRTQTKAYADGLEKFSILKDLTSMHANRYMAQIYDIQWFGNSF